MQLGHTEANGKGWQGVKCLCCTVLAWVALRRFRTQPLPQKTSDPGSLTHAACKSHSMQGSDRTRLGWLLWESRRCWSYSGLSKVF